MNLNDKYLGSPCKHVAEGEDVSRIVKGMIRLCYDKDGKRIGIGLAANQAGYDKRIIVTNYGTFSEGMINPVIEKYRGGIYKSKEGCLSFPNKLVTVIRHKIIKVSWFDELWNKQSRSMHGLLAAIVQHEMDHINGIDMFERKRIGMVLLK